MNIGSLLTMNHIFRNQLNTSQKAIQSHMEKISSAKQINRASDDPSRMLRLSRLEAEIRGKEVGNQNIQNATSFLQKKDSALETIQDIGQDLRELSIKYNNETLSEGDRELIQREAGAMTEELVSLLGNTKFNKQNVFDPKDLQIQTGGSSSESYIISGSNEEVVSLKNLDKLNIDEVLNLEFIDKEILDPVAKERSQGLIDQSILKRKLAHNQSQQVTQQESLSRIQDTNVAKEMMEVVKNQMLLLTNASLIQDTTEFHRNNIMQLLHQNP